MNLNTNINFKLFISSQDNINSNHNYLCILIVNFVILLKRAIHAIVINIYLFIFKHSKVHNIAIF